MQHVLNVSLKPIEYLYGEPTIRWKKQEVLSSGRVIGKPIANQAKQEWMKTRKNKYQRDKRGHIIEDKQGKQADKGKGKAKLEEISTKNKFNALEVEEVPNPILQITEGKGEENTNDNKKEQGEKQSKRVQEKESEFKPGMSSPNPNATGSRVTDEKNNSNPAGEGIQEELIHVKKEAVDRVLEIEKTGNHNTTGIHSTPPKVNPSSLKTWVDDNSSSMMMKAWNSIGGGQGEFKAAGNPNGLAQTSLSNKKANGAVNPSKTWEILAFVDGVPVYALEKGLDEGVPIEFRKDTVCQYQQTVHGKDVDLNGTITSGSLTTVNPNLGFVYELQFRMMRENLGNMERTSNLIEAALTPYEPVEQPIVTRELGELGVTACGMRINNWITNADPNQCAIKDSK
ncbi:hypothetical protein A4A49_05993 [Nicotiana attenuata]|uniref:Uncharacterized protein n=1 Tax=Nicotiana attenuata TaxID=49451 RepID=A0A314LCS7_NICAT|nr:hypothetical protein A4A49_05993 [Nicotiana attenuata]